MDPTNQDWDQLSHKFDQLGDQLVTFADATSLPGHEILRDRLSTAPVVITGRSPLRRAIQLFQSINSDTSGFDADFERLVRAGIHKFYTEEEDEDDNDDDDNNSVEL